jgi:membrane-associated phospholipid phosphatase
VIGNFILMALFFLFILNVVVYNWTGHLYPEGSGFRLDGMFWGLDNAIPFVPETVIFYKFLFYGMCILTLLYFGLVDYEKGYALGWSLVLINAIATVFYILFPVSTYWWRQDLLAHRIVGNFWADQVYDVFAIDPSFNCFPSLHSAISITLFYAWYQRSKTKPSSTTRVVAVLALFIAVGTILSTLFIKQHYIADAIAGIALAVCIDVPLFKHFWKPFKPVEVPVVSSEG